MCTHAASQQPQKRYTTVHPRGKHTRVRGMRVCVRARMEASSNARFPDLWGADLTTASVVHAHGRALLLRKASAGRFCPRRPRGGHLVGRGTRPFPAPGGGAGGCQALHIRVACMRAGVPGALVLLTYRNVPIHAHPLRIPALIQSVRDTRTRWVSDAFVRGYLLKPCGGHPLLLPTSRWSLLLDLSPAFHPPPPAAAAVDGCMRMARGASGDSRRLSHAVDRLDAVCAGARELAARHVFDVCVYHVTRTRTVGVASSRGRGRLLASPPAPTPTAIFDIVHPHVARIARRLDRAMRHAETSPHPADIAALIVAVDAQGALAALFAVAQNAGCDHAELELLAAPLRKRSAPALLRCLFSADMRVANAAKKALRQVGAIACCQMCVWMGAIGLALDIRAGNRPTTALTGLLDRLKEILGLVVKDMALGAQVVRKKSSRGIANGIAVGGRGRHTLATERRRTESRNAWKGLWMGGWALLRISSRVTEDNEGDWRWRKRAKSDGQSSKRATVKTESTDDIRSVASGGAISTAGSYVGSVFSNVTEEAKTTLEGKKVTTIKRDAATAMYIFEQLLSKRINPLLEDRIEVITTLADIAQVTFSGTFATSHKIEPAQHYSRAMATVFTYHGKHIYSIVLDILFRPVKESDASRIGVFSFHDAGVLQFGSQTPYNRRTFTQFPQTAVCLPNMGCTGLAAVSCNSLLKLLIRHVPEMCSQRMALLTGTINSAFLHSSEALRRTEDGCSWQVSKIVSAVDALALLVVAIPSTLEAALELIVKEPVTLRLVIETCIRSVSATGRLLAQNAARNSAPRLSDEGTLDSLRSWQALIAIIPNTSSWADSPSYPSSILFLAQVARRAALIAVLQGYRREGKLGRRGQDNVRNEAYPSGSASRSGVSMEETGGSGSSNMGGSRAGFEVDEENVLANELHNAIIAMINLVGMNPASVFFELYRTVVYLYATELQKHHRVMAKAASLAVTGGASSERAQAPELGNSSSMKNEGHSNRRIGVPGATQRTQSEEEAKGVLVENIAVDGQLPSRALRRAVMASELDLGGYFDSSSGQPLSLQHLDAHQKSVPPGVHTFEEFSQAIAIIIGALYSKSMLGVFEDPQEAAEQISQDVQRSGSPYLERVHKRARSILKNDSFAHRYVWKAERYEERIRKLEEEVAHLKNLVQSSLEGGLYFSKRRSLPKMLGLSGDLQDNKEVQSQQVDPLKCPSSCFCPT